LVGIAAFICEDRELDLGSSTSASVKLSLKIFYFVVCRFQRKCAFVISCKEYSMERLSVDVMTREGNTEISISNTEENFTVLVHFKEAALLLYSICENFVSSEGL